MFREAVEFPTYCTIGVQELLVLCSLKLDPSRIWVTIAVPFGKGRNGLLSLVVDKQPSGTFWNDPHEDDDQTRKDHLWTLSTSTRWIGEYL